MLWSRSSSCNVGTGVVKDRSQKLVALSLRQSHDNFVTLGLDVWQIAVRSGVNRIHGAHGLVTKLAVLSRCGITEEIRIEVQKATGLVAA